MKCKTCALAYPIKPTYRSYRLDDEKRFGAEWRCEVEDDGIMLGFPDAVDCDFYVRETGSDD